MKNSMNLNTEVIDYTTKVTTNKLVKFGPIFIGGSLSPESFTQLKKRK